MSAVCLHVTSAKEIFLKISLLQWRKIYIFFRKVYLQRVADKKQIKGNGTGSSLS